MKIKTIALVASALIGTVGATSSFAADQSCGAGSCSKKAQMKDHCTDKDKCDMEMKKTDQSCGAGSCSKKMK